MAVRVQQNTATQGSGNSLAVSLSSAAAAGNLLVSSMSADKDTGSAPAPSAGWTALVADNSASVSVAMAYKLADGDASDTCTWSWSSSVFSSGAHIIEYEPPSGTLNTPVIDTDLTAEAGETSVSMSATADGAGLAVAMIGKDSGANFTWTGDLAEQADFAASFNSGLGVADKLDVTDAEAISATATLPIADPADQLSGILALFGWTAGTAHTQEPAEAPSVADAATKAAGKALADAPSVTDAEAKAITKALADSASIADVLAKAPALALTEAPAATDAASPDLGDDRAPEITLPTAMSIDTAEGSLLIAEAVASHAIDARTDEAALDALTAQASVDETEAGAQIVAEEATAQVDSTESDLTLS